MCCSSVEFTPKRTFVQRRQGRPFPDPLVKVYDTRTLRPLPPVPFSAGPGFIDLLPKRSATIVITSAGGLVNVVDVSNVTNSEFYQVRHPSVCVLYSLER